MKKKRRIFKRKTKQVEKFGLWNHCRKSNGRINRYACINRHKNHSKYTAWNCCKNCSIVKAIIKEEDKLSERKVIKRNKERKVIKRNKPRKIIRRRNG